MISAGQAECRAVGGFVSRQIKWERKQQIKWICIGVRKIPVQSMKFFYMILNSESGVE